jgi:hypothetical protein
VDAPDDVKTGRGCGGSFEEDGIFSVWEATTGAVFFSKDIVQYKTTSYIGTPPERSFN